MKLQRLTLAHWIVVELLGQHEVDHIFDVRDRDRALSNVCRNDDFSSSLHEGSIPESLVLLVLAQ